tara:strand:+ start:4298 stop:4948 length:651 start_codon:yes stop_codon:yes gene_type:complete
MSTPVLLVRANTLTETIQAYAQLQSLLTSSATPYDLHGIHGGAFAAAWVLSGVSVEELAMALCVAQSAIQLAQLTLGESAVQRCNDGGLTIYQARGNAWRECENPLIVRRNFGCARDLREALALSVTLPKLADGYCTLAKVSALNSTKALLEIHRQTTATINVISGDAVQCLRTFSPVSAAYTVGIWSLANGLPRELELPSPAPDAPETPEQNPLQ